MTINPEPGPDEAINFGDPVEPRLAATLILMRGGGRHSGRGLEVLMLRRGELARFMPGVWVFPGGKLEVADGEGLDGLMACARRELAEEAGIELDGEAELTPFSRWITPEVIQKRFDTYFFLGRAPSHVAPRPDGTEMDEARWVEPQAALDANSAGDMPIVFPTLKQLESLAGFATPEEAIEAAAADPSAIEPILPKVVGSGREHRILLPKDPDYPE